MKTIIIDGIEYNLTPKVLFKKGDFVVIQETTYQITKVENLNVTLSLNGRECIFDMDVLKNAHLWTIEDAKDGDVLSCLNDAGDRDVIFIFKNINSDEGWVFCFCAIDANGCFCTNNDYVGNSNSTNISPATKEQRDILFQKMKEAGYEWNAEKKELKKIEQMSITMSLDEAIEHCKEKSCGNNACALEHKQLAQWLKELKGYKEQKSVWGEGDEKMFECALNMIEWYSGVDEDKSKPVSDWLKSLKDRYTWKPSEEQLHYLSWIANIKLGDGIVEQEVSKHLNELLEDLKKLREE